MRQHLIKIFHESRILMFPHEHLDDVDVDHPTFNHPIKDHAECPIRTVAMEDCTSFYESWLKKFYARPREGIFIDLTEVCNFHFIHIRNCILH